MNATSGRIPPHYWSVLALSPIQVWLPVSFFSKGSLHKMFAEVGDRVAGFKWILLKEAHWDRFQNKNYNGRVLEIRSTRKVIKKKYNKSAAFSKKNWNAEQITGTER